MAAPRPKVFVVDDDPAVRNALDLLLASESHEVEPFSSAEAFLDAYDEGQPGCLLLDIRMPGMSGLELQEKLKGADIHIPIIFMSGHGDVSASVRAFRSGAVTFLEKPFNNRELLAAVDEALERDARARERAGRCSAALARYACLTGREKEVMGHMVAGKSNKQIARELEISHRTIEVHRARVMTKMQVPSLSDLVALAIDGGLAPEAGMRADRSRPA